MPEKLEKIKLIMLRFFFLFGMLVPLVATANVILESDQLILSVQIKPYSYQLFSKVENQILLRQEQTFIKTKGKVRRVTEASVVKISSGSAELLVILDHDKSLTARIRLRFVDPAILRVAIAHDLETADDAVMRTNVSISEQFLDQGENIFGLWEYPYGPSLDNRGVDQELLGAMGKTDEKGKKIKTVGANFVSARAPFYFTDRNNGAKYGIYVRSLWRGRYSLGVNRRTQFEFDDTELDYFIIYGETFRKVLQLHNEIAGSSFVPPDWALGSIWWRNDPVAGTGFLGTAGSDGAKVLKSDAHALSQLKIPASAMWIDRPYLLPESRDVDKIFKNDKPFYLPGWGGLVDGQFQFDRHFKNPKKLLSDLSLRGLRVMGWVANLARGDLRNEGMKLNFLFADGQGATDIRNIQAYEWIKDKLVNLVQHGMKGFKIDRGDEHQAGEHSRKEVPPHVMNYNAAYFPKLAKEALEQVHGKDTAHDRDGTFMLARSAYDGARAYTGVWNGDTKNKWEGLRESIKHGLRSGLINFPVWGSDTGSYGKTDGELFARWSQFSCFTPIMEILIGPGRTPWIDFSKPYRDAIVAATQLRHLLIPYTRSYLYQAKSTGLPIMRPMFLEFEDSKLKDIADQYMYGSEFLVAPIIESKAMSRRVYFPVGQWRDYFGDFSSEKYSGPVEINVPVQLSKMPVYVKSGSIVVTGDVHAFTNDWQSEWRSQIKIQVYPVHPAYDAYDAYDGADSVASRKSSAQSSYKSPCQPSRAQFNYFDGYEIRKILAFFDLQKIEIEWPRLGVERVQLEIECPKPNNIWVNNVPINKNNQSSPDIQMKLEKGNVVMSLPDLNYTVSLQCAQDGWD